MLKDDLICKCLLNSQSDKKIVKQNRIQADRSTGDFFLCYVIRLRGIHYGRTSPIIRTSLLYVPVYYTSQFCQDSSALRVLSHLSEIDYFIYFSPEVYWVWGHN